MANRERVLDEINSHPEGIDDDTLSEKLQIEPRQQIRQIAAALELEGLVERRSIRKKNGGRKKIHNIPTPELCPQEKELIHKIVDEEIFPELFTEETQLRKIIREELQKVFNDKHEFDCRISIEFHPKA